MVLDFRSDDGRTVVYHREGVAWFEAPLPRLLHRHTVQTEGYLDFEKVERCACGAIRLGGRGRWLDRNRRRRSRSSRENLDFSKAGDA